MKCSNCENEKVHAKGLCSNCYARYLKYGDPARRKVKKVAECSYCGEIGLIKANNLCPACYGRWLKNGTPERIKVKKRAPCAFCGVEKEIHANGLCGPCYQRNLKKGTLEYDRVRHVCSVDGCDRTVVGNGLCQKHYKRWQRHGHTEATRPNGWGAKEKHPLRYSYDHYVRRTTKYPVCEEWKSDFWNFVRDISERPSIKHRLRRIDNSLPLSKANHEWYEPIFQKPNTDGAKASKAEYARAYRAANERNIKNTFLKKNFGITIDQYEAMAERQKNKCAICGNPEKAKNPKTGKTNSLCVDHCHASNRIRGLLC